VSLPLFIAPSTQIRHIASPPSHAVYADAYRLLPLSFLPYLKNRIGNLQSCALVDTETTALDRLTVPLLARGMPVVSSPIGNQDLFQISDRLFTKLRSLRVLLLYIWTPNFNDITVSEHSENKE
jgi:hypothetical protein